MQYIVVAYSECGPRDGSRNDREGQVSLSQSVVYPHPATTQCSLQ